MDCFWTSNPKILFTEALEFWPGGDKSFEQRLNATSRFFLYGGVILGAYKQDLRLPLVSVLIMLMIVVVAKARGANKQCNRGKVSIAETKETVYEEPTQYETQEPPPNAVHFPDKDAALDERRMFKPPDAPLSGQADFAEFLYGGPNEKSRCY